MDIYGIQKLTLLDYPGKTACTLFSGGCNFRCPFCHNSDLVFRENVSPISQTELFDFLKKRKKVLDGVCITGGEPLLNVDICDFIQKLRCLGYSVKLDTNGSNPRLLGKIISEGLVDYVAMDVKNSLEKYAETIGVPEFDTIVIKESIALLINSGIDFEFRTTFTNELHSDESVKDIALMINGAKRYCLQSYRESENILKKGLTAPDAVTIKRWAEYFKDCVNTVQIRG